MLRGLQLQSLLWIAALVIAVQTDFREDLVNLINEKRAIHNATPVYSEEGDWAFIYGISWDQNYLHCEDLDDFLLIFSSVWCGLGESAQNVEPATIVNEWYDGINYYNFENPEINKDNIKFVSMVWQSSTQVVFGKKSSSQATFVSIEYSPTIDYNVDLSDEVLPPKM